VQLPGSDCMPKLVLFSVIPIPKLLRKALALSQKLPPIVTPNRASEVLYGKAFMIFLAIKKNIKDLPIYAARKTVNAKENVIATVLKYIL
jgi:hypothetical protein